MLVEHDYLKLAFFLLAIETGINTDKMLLYYVC